MKNTLCTSRCLIFSFKFPQYLQSNFSSSQLLLAFHPASFLARMLWWVEQSFELRLESRTRAIAFLHIGICFIYGWTVPIFSILKTAFQEASTMNKMSAHVSSRWGVWLEKASVRGRTISFFRTVVSCFFFFPRVNYNAQYFNSKRFLFNPCTWPPKLNTFELCSKKDIETMAQILSRCKPWWLRGFMATSLGLTRILSLWRRRALSFIFHLWYCATQASKTYIDLQEKDRTYQFIYLCL